MKFLALSKLPFWLANHILALALPKYGVFFAIILLYIVLGMFLDVFVAVILTIPVIFPIITALGFDPIWFGVIIVLVLEMGLITPPMGLNVYVLSGGDGYSAADHISRCDTFYWSDVDLCGALSILSVDRTVFAVNDVRGIR